MKKFIGRTLMLIGAVNVLMMIFGLISISLLFNKKEDVKPETVLEIDFGRELVEYMPENAAAQMMIGEVTSVRDVVEGLVRAAEDDRVKGLVAKIGRPSMGFAQIQEIRDAVRIFRESGKTAIAYSDTFGEFGPGNGAYYLASAFDKICLQPSGDVGLTGLILETQFLKGTLEKIEVKPRMDHRYEYKNAMNTFTEEKYTAPHKKALEDILASFFGQMVTQIGKDRDIPETKIRSLVNKGLFLGQEAMDASLVDMLGYRDMAYEDIRQTVGQNADFISLSSYLKRAGRPFTEGETIALIYGVGSVHRGKSNYSPLSGDTVMGSDTVTKAFRAAVEDEDVRAIVFRVNSPGGSYVASDSIWRETIRAKEAGKPVIVTMSNVAGSGGYFVAMAANKVVAQPATITGSIGVLGGKMLTTDFWKKLGISWDEVHTGQNADMWTGLKDYNQEQWTRFQDMLDRIYEDFTDKVAQGRGLKKARVLEIAKGRIWSGEDAKALGLVDELGGFLTAIRLAREEAGIGEDENIQLKLFPKKKDLKEIIIEKLARSTSVDESASASMTHVFHEIQPLVRTVKSLGITNDRANQGVLTVNIPYPYDK
ncbi:signal peptide peptidase SppA [Desulfobacterales bacterium HSG16]|nr:signal peptide peptidase SppA [Desulfobacterales bacterium HSG16]